ncbi:MAG: carboxypeptidase regulatory-like domain-containing protein, partial [Elusimicrobiota bacterium]|nr:carboxypeptidase regulatory-like domain-containing protein [Elusimicrobiota bacterium]
MDTMKSILIGLVLLILLSSNGLAHKVNLFAYAENGMVYTESYFSDGRKVIDSTVEVFDAQNNKLL